MKRRDFLRSFSNKNVSPPQIASEPVQLLSVSRSAMAADFEFEFSSVAYPQGTAAALDALDRVQILERKLSVFISESEVEYINRIAAFDPIHVDDELFDLIQFCLKLNDETDGAFDITNTPLWKLWGFARRQTRFPSEQEIDEALQNVGSKFVELNENEKTIRFTKPGIQLNFGCIGKGLALDLASPIPESHGVNDFQFHGGMSSVLARGDFNKSQQSNGWTIGVAHPMYHERRLAEITLRNQSLGTSGTQKQFFIHKGRRFGHIFDPRTGYPTEKTLMITVIADTAAEADALSTAFFVMTPDDVEKYRSTHAGISVLMVLATPHAPGFEIVTFDAEENSFRFL